MSNSWIAKLIFFIFLFSCNSNNTTVQNKQVEKEFDIIESVIESSKFGMNQLGIQEIDKEENDKFRLWRFPEGGTVFEEMYELDLESKILKMNSYLIKGLDKEERIEYSDLIFSHTIEQNQTSLELITLIKNSKFHLSKSGHEYCTDFPYLSDYFLIEIRHKNKTNRFGLGESIKDCEKEEVQNLKKLYQLAIEMIAENSEY